MTCAATIRTIDKEDCMPKTIEFYFDFTSPYGYLASRRIESIAAKHDREIVWRPILLGAIFKISGRKPLLDIPLLGDYSNRDIARSAREYAIECRIPEPFPIGTVSAARAVYWLAKTSKNDAVRLIHALYRAYFVDGINISDTDQVLAIAAATGVDRDQLANALQDPEVKARLKNAVDEAIESGVFGSPCCIVDGEPFWGNDRLDQLDKWLTLGGW